MLKSIKNNKIGIALMIVSSICVCFGQLFWKLSVYQGLRIMILGFIFYAIGALCMIIGYKFGKLSILQPILSLNYALSIVLGFFFLGEAITMQKISGILIIMCGVVFIAGGDEV